MDRGREAREVTICNIRAISDKLGDDKVVIPGVVDGPADYGKGMTTRGWSRGALVVVAASRASTRHNEARMTS